MKLSDGEKLILLMLSEIYEKLEIEGSFDADFIASSITTDNTWGIKWKYSGIPFADKEDPDIVTEVVDILEMWEMLEYSYDKLNEPARDNLAGATEISESMIKFPGFDGNNEWEHHSVALFLIKQLGRFSSFEAINSHMPTLDMHRRMLKAYKSLEIESGSPLPGLTTIQIISVVNERVHPDSQ